MRLCWLVALLGVVGCSVLRNPDDFEVVEDAGRSDGEPDATGDGGGCMMDEDCPRLDNASVRCDAGQCVLDACLPLFGDCDGERTNGCERALDAASDCGACNMACEGAADICDVSGDVASCVSQCTDGRVQCGDTCRDLLTDAAACGDCGNACVLPEGAERATCEAGTCGFLCRADFEDCDGVGANGCEVDTRSDPLHCDGCGEVCTLGENVLSASCVASACGVGSCQAGWGDCDGTTDNGCELSLDTVADCGACGNVCGAGQSCVNGTCDGFVEIDTSRFHVCARRESGAVDCWGSNESNQYADGPPRPAERPTRIRWAPDGVEVDFRARSVSVGPGITCLVSDHAGSLGRLYCMGSNTSTRGGRAPGTPNAPPQLVELRGPSTEDIRFTRVVSRDEHSCAIDEDGTLWCFGPNYVDQTGPDVEMTRYAQRVPLPDDVVDVATTTSATCAVLEDGRVFCFGANDEGQLGRGMTGEPSGMPIQVQGLSGVDDAIDVRRVVAGTEEFCAIRGDNALVCWGENLNGSIRTASGEVVSPHEVATDVQDAFMFHLTTCWIDGDGSAWCRGRRGENQFGEGPMPGVVYEPQRVPGLDGMSGADGGYHGGCGLRDGEAYCWGYSTYGQIPRSSLLAETPESIVDADGEVISDLGHLTDNLNGACGIRSGVAYCWGAGGRSESGDGTNIGEGHPKAVPGLTNVVDIARGGSGVCAITHNEGSGENQLWCWGSNASGVTAGAPYSSTPTRVLDVVDPLDVEMGILHGCARLRGGSVTCWGSNALGQVTGMTSAQLAPTEVRLGATGLDAVDIAVGANFSCALLADPMGEVVCWGQNNRGQLGVAAGDVIGVVRSSLPRLGALELGFQHGCGLTLEDTPQVVCWGQGDFGQLGSGATTDGVHTHAAGGPVAVSVAAGMRSSCAAYEDRSVRCWGNNDMFQLGVSGPSVLAPQVVPGVEASVVHNSFQASFSNCAGDPDGSWECWGLNAYGKLGTDPVMYFAPTLIDRSTP